MTYNDRVAGTLFGLACGDALGTTLEFSSGAPGAEDFSHRLTGPHTDITGGGPFHVAPGQVTDDTMMATCIARTIVEHAGYNSHLCAERYRRWQHVTFDIGGITAASLARVRDVGALGSGREAWERSGRTACGNGALMRCAVLGAVYASDMDANARHYMTFLDSAITHFDPRSILSCAAMNGAVAALVRGAPLEAVAQAALQDMSAVANIISRHHSDVGTLARFALGNIWEDVHAMFDDHPFAGLLGVALVGPTAGFVRTALRLAFWELGHATSYSEGLIDCVNRGGDADTNGAITGALLGARFGFAGIPAEWTARVSNALQDGPPSPLRDEFHPKAFAGLIE